MPFKLLLYRIINFIYCVQHKKTNFLPVNGSIFTCVMLASTGISCCHPSVTSRCSTEMAKRRITQAITQ